MFNFGFSELVLVGIVALLVLGPEKMPGAVRTAALWIGRLRRSFNTIKQDIEREIGADEIRRQLRNEEIMEKFRNAQTQIQNTIKEAEKGTEEFTKNVELEARAAAGNFSDPQAEAASMPATASADAAALSADQESALVTPVATAPAAEAAPPNAHS
ncbi:MAG: Sec-independent protein translocase protein TatB [Pseudomonadales bacterium]|jgi:sec-independent protein translocase protein TatB|nr:Sec-independent protein translocase protein TatB [Pseudomonadales bacterium]